MRGSSSSARHGIPGVVGIVAGRVSRRYNRPCIVLGNEGDMAKGSGRSVDGVSLVEILAKCPEGLASWGGHPMAVGVSLPKVGADGLPRAVRIGGARPCRLGHRGAAPRHLRVA